MNQQGYNYISTIIFTMGVHRGAKRAFAPLEIRTKNQKFLENMKSAS